MTKRSLLATAAVLSMLFALLPFTAAGAAPAGDLFFSEYVEGSGYNKAIEIYNGTGATVDLATYDLELYSNGSATVSQTLNLAGHSVADGDVFVIAYSAGSNTADQALLDEADLLDSATAVNWNGDDAVVLRNNGLVVDSIGQVGFDPGSTWGTGSVQTQNDTLRRKASVCAGDTDPGDAYDPAGEWDGYPQDTFDGVGSHTATCDDGGGTTTTTTEATTTTTTMAPGGDVADVIINEVDADTAGTDVAEFIELYAVSGGVEDLSGLSIVLVNGSDDLGYGAYDLDGYSTGADGYFVLCNVGVPNCDAPIIPSNGVQNGADAVVLVNGNAADYPNDSAQPADGVIVDAIVYDTNDSDDAGILGLINAGQPQVNEGGAGDSAGHSNQRCPDATGGNRNTDTYEQWAPTPGAANDCRIVPVERLIHEIQGSGSASPLVGTGAIIEGVVTGDYQGYPGLGGFYVQEEDGDADADASTSEGIFVFEGGTFTDVSVGDVVKVTGEVQEGFDQTQIGNVESIEITGSGASVTPTSVSLPVSSLGYWETIEGMQVEFHQTLFVTEVYTLGQYGEVLLSSGGPLDNPTNVVAPGAAAQALQDANNLNAIQLDDGVSWSNYDPTPYLGMGGTLRGGDSTDGLAGIVGYSFGAYEIQPIGPVTFDRVNDRPAGLPAVGGDLTVASFNVLNYFSTIDTGAPICGPSANQDCRGADSNEEFDRQRTKIINAIVKLDADVVGLMEIENHATDDALADLVDGLNAAAGAGTYASVATGPVGTDAIKTAIIYKPATVSPSGAYAVLDSSVDPLFNDDKSRPVIAQTFSENSTGELFTVAVNHLKSKGSDCNDLGDPDTGDGQGNCNLTRTDAATALVNWLAGDPTGSGDSDALIIGDLNAYAMEDPISAIKAAGYTDLVASYQGVGRADGAYSYVFAGQWGYLDHALANGTMTAQVTGTDYWHINSDEPPALDYQSWNLPANQTSDEFRSSDHDAVVVGLTLDGANAEIKRARALLESAMTGDRWTDRSISKAIDSLDKALRSSYWTADDIVESRKVFDYLAKATRDIDAAARRSLDDDVADAANDKIVGAARAVAALALETAAVDPASPKHIGHGEWWLEFGDRAADAGYESHAILRYKQAWLEADRAINPPWWDWFGWL